MPLLRASCCAYQLQADILKQKPAASNPETCAASQIYYSVDNVEPWMSGNARGTTSAFCLLMRLGQLKPTDEQVQQLLDHKDSPYIRAVGADPSSAALSAS